MTNVYLDTEFNSYQGELLSLALYVGVGHYLYLRIAERDLKEETRPWVAEHILPIMDCGTVPLVLTRAEAATAIETFLQWFDDVVIISDWPVDIQHFCELIITGPGEMINIPGFKTEVQRVDAYPVAPGYEKRFEQHNALSDAMALKLRLTRPDLYAIADTVPPTEYTPIEFFY